MTHLQDNQIKLIPNTVICHANNIEELMKRIMEQKQHKTVYVKSADYSECAEGVVRVKLQSQPKKAVKSNLMDMLKCSSMFLIQPSHKELEHGSLTLELKLYLMEGRFLYGLAQERLKKHASYLYHELRQDAASWNTYKVPQAIQVAMDVYKSIQPKSPTLAEFCRVDVIWSEEYQNFVVNEIDHFGCMWLLLEHTSKAVDLLKIIVSKTQCMIDKYVSQ
jgi:hypothetical protein